MFFGGLPYLYSQVVVARAISRGRASFKSDRGSYAWCYEKLCYHYLSDIELKLRSVHFDHSLFLAFTEISLPKNTCDCIYSGNKINSPFLLLLFKRAQCDWWQPAVSKKDKTAR